MNTVDDRGVMNSFAKEPKMSYAEYPSPEQQRRYWIQGGLFTVGMIGLLLIAYAVS